MADAARSRLDAQAAYVLHSYPYKETSLVLELFVRDHGRLALVARGARRPRSALRGVLLAFQPLLLNWGGKGELKTLYGAEWQGGLPQLTGRALLCGFYLNELIVRLLPRDDPHEVLYEAYDLALRTLAAGGNLAAALRRFEKCLLGEIGYGLILDHDIATGAPIDPALGYSYRIGAGPVRVAVRAEHGDGPGAGELDLLGKTLLDMRRDDYTDATTAQQSRALMRMLINHYLGDQSLNTRQLLQDLRQL